MSTTARDRGRVFKPAIDPKIAIVLGVIVGWLIPAGAWLALNGRFTLGWVMMLSGALPAVLFLPIRYRLTAELLVVRSGFFRWQIPLPLIFEVKAESNTLAAPALSRNRLVIRFHTDGDDDGVRIAPRERAAFLLALKAAAPHVELVGPLEAEAAAGPHA